jgi:CRISPR-associated exonuclease Cas4
MAIPALGLAAVALLFVLIGAALALWGSFALSRRRSDARFGALRAVDAGRPAVLRSYRYQIQGRPDLLRQVPDGRLVPVEVKSRSTPGNGPARSHLVQVWAYCLLVEESTGYAPPFGVLRYSDQEYRVDWDARARRDLLAVRADVARPYDGRATPSPARCRRCAWVDRCDARRLSP